MSENANSPALTIGPRDGRLLPLAGYIACLLLMSFTSVVDATDPRPIVKGVDRAAAARVGRIRPAGRFLESPGISIAKLSRATLARSDDVRGNLDELFELGIREGRLNEPEAVRDLPLYAGMRTRGDFALLECLKVETCQLERFPQLADQVGPDQLLLQHAARCINCNQINIRTRAGITTEKVMHGYFQRNGWQRLEGEIGNSGIDGLYVKRDRAGNLADLLMVEAKYGTSKLAKRQSGTQLSKAWILDNLSKLESHALANGRAGDERAYRKLRQSVEAGRYRAQVWRMIVDQDQIFLTRAEAISEGRTVDLRPLPDRPSWKAESDGRWVVDTNGPVSVAERAIVDDYLSAISESAARPFVD